MYLAIGCEKGDIMSFIGRGIWCYREEWRTRWLGYTATGFLKNNGCRSDIPEFCVEVETSIEVTGGDGTDMKCCGTEGCDLYQLSV